MKKCCSSLAAISVFLGGCATLSSAATLYFVDDTNHHLYSLDLTTRAVTDVGALGIDGGAMTFGDLTYDSTNRTMYYSGGRGDENLYTINLTTGAATLVGADNQTDMFGLGYDPTNNTLYGATSTDGGDEFGSINKSTGAFTPIGTTGLYNEGLTYNRATGQMILSNMTSIYSVNVATGATTLLGTPGFANDNGITYDAGSGVYWVYSYANSLGSLFEVDATTLTQTNEFSLRFNDVSSVAYVASTPEPVTMAFLGFGAAAMLRCRRRRDS